MQENHAKILQDEALLIPLGSDRQMISLLEVECKAASHAGASTFAVLSLGPALLWIFGLSLGQLWQHLLQGGLYRNGNSHVSRLDMPCIIFHSIALVGVISKS